MPDEATPDTIDQQSLKVPLWLMEGEGRVLLRWCLFTQVCHRQSFTFDRQAWVDKWRQVHDNSWTEGPRECLLTDFLRRTVTLLSALQWVSYNECPPVRVLAWGFSGECLDIERQAQKRPRAQRLCQAPLYFKNQPFQSWFSDPLKTAEGYDACLWTYLKYRLYDQRTPNVLEDEITGKREWNRTKKLSQITV